MAKWSLGPRHRMVILLAEFILLAEYQQKPTISGEKRKIVVSAPFLILCQKRMLIIRLQYLHQIAGTWMMYYTRQYTKAWVRIGENAIIELWLAALNNYEHSGWLDFSEQELTMDHSEISTAPHQALSWNEWSMEILMEHLSLSDFYLGERW